MQAAFGRTAFKGTPNTFAFSRRRRQKKTEKIHTPLRSLPVFKEGPPPTWGTLEPPFPPCQVDVMIIFDYMGSI